MTLTEAREELNITVDLLPVSNSNRPGRELVPRHVTIHNTDNPARGADARAHARYMKGRDAQQRQVSWHFTVDDGVVFQSLPVREVGWHSGSGNSRSLGLEICENEGIDQEAANRRAALLTAVLLKENGIPVEGGVVQHNFWTGKDCPHLLRAGSGWKDFLSLVAAFHAELGDSLGDDCTLCGDEGSVVTPAAVLLEPPHPRHDGHGTSNPNPKPAVNESRRSPYHSSRNGGDIHTVVLHFTDGGTLQSVLRWFENNPRQVSAHYVIGRGGEIYQMVRDDERANHCAGANRHSIGIEHVASAGQSMTDAQERSSIALLRWLHRQYEIPLANINGHRYTEGYSGGEGGTDCPHSLFGDRNEEAIRDWVRRNIAPEMPPAGMSFADLEIAAPDRGSSRPFSTEPARSGNASGSSETTGLRGTVTALDSGVEVTDASETLHAIRERRDLGTKTVRQIRTKRGDETLVEQPNYCWQARDLPTARLIENSDGFGSAGNVIQGKATYFGKYDRADEGTGTPLFKIVQTNSSVFAMSLPRATLLREGFATQQGNRLRPTQKGLTALIEVYFPPTRRLMKLPLADIGPAPSTRAVADLTVAAVAWLLNRRESEAEGYGLPNPDIEMRLP